VRSSMAICRGVNHAQSALRLVPSARVRYSPCMRTHSGYHVAVVFCVAFTCRVSSVEAQGPSFSCAAATTASERMICAEPTLAREDVLLARLYGAARRSAPLGNPGNGHVAAQRRWLAQRAQCELGGSEATIELRECLRLAYQSRIAELATAALYTDRELALATLRERDPATAPLVEAVLVHASHPAGSDWTSAALRADRERIRALIGGPLQSFLGTPNVDFARTILINSNVNSLDDAFASDERFAMTIKLLAVDAEVPMRIPCEAIARRPDLQDLEEPIFGSSMDLLLPRSDCADALPPAPRLQALDDALWREWPECDGSIKHAAYASYALQFSAARRGAPLAAPASANLKLPRRVGVSTQVVESAIEELTTQYQVYRGYKAEAARAVARTHMVALLASAHSCGGEVEDPLIEEGISERGAPRHSL